MVHKMTTIRFAKMEDQNGKGIGKLLFNELNSETTKEGVNGISRQLTEWIEPPLNFYRKYQAEMGAGILRASPSKRALLNYQ
jgi:hypothetical protein